MSRLASSLLALILLAATSVVALPPLTAAADSATDHSAVVLVPFAGQWANELATAPWEHPRASVEDWTLDLFAPDTDVVAHVGRATGIVSLHISPPDPYGCVGGGSMVWVEVHVDGIAVGGIGYHHLVDIEYPDGAVIDGPEARLGSTAANPGDLGGACWRVSTPSGIHAHLIAANTTGYSCFADYDKGTQLDAEAPLAALGGPDGGWGAGPRSACPPAALQLGEPPLPPPTEPPGRVLGIAVEVDPVPTEASTTSAAAFPTPGAGVTVTWLPPTEGEVPEDYRVVFESEGIPTLLTSTQSATTSARVTTLEGGLTYLVTVIASNAAGDGPPSEPVQVFVPVRPLEGYWLVDTGGVVHPFGDATHMGDPSPSADPATAVTSSPSGGGYWILTSSGTVYAYGDAQHHGNAHLDPTERAIALGSTPDGDGYWVFSDSGRVMALGAAIHYGDVGHIALNGPIVAATVSASGRGYYLVGAEGGVFALGDATYQGSIQQYLDLHRDAVPARSWLEAPIIGVVPSPDGAGYWLVASDGGIFAFGSAEYRGSIPQVLPGVALNAPVNGAMPYGNGYLMVATDGGIFAFSDKPFVGSLGDTELAAPISGASTIGAS